MTIPLGKNSSVDVAAPELFFPNGMVISPDGATLTVAESGAHRLTAFDIAPDGSLSRRRVIAELDAPHGDERGRPDGICLAPDGSLWVADPSCRRIVRIAPDGRLVQTLTIDGQVPLAPVLDGTGTRLFVTSGALFDQRAAVAARTGRITAFDLAS
jgi:sugar lactone lactonase YvrE